MRTGNDAIGSGINTRKQVRRCPIYDYYSGGPTALIASVNKAEPQGIGSEGLLAYKQLWRKHHAKTNRCLYTHTYIIYVCILTP